MVRSFEDVWAEILEDAHCKDVSPLAPGGFVAAEPSFEAPGGFVAAELSSSDSYAELQELQNGLCETSEI